MCSQSWQHPKMCGRTPFTSNNPSFRGGYAAPLAQTVTPFGVHTVFYPPGVGQTRGDSSVPSSWDRRMVLGRFALGTKHGPCIPARPQHPSGCRGCSPGRRGW